MPVKTNFDVFSGFFTGGSAFSRTLFSVFFTPTFFSTGTHFIFFHGQNISFHGGNFDFIFSRVAVFFFMGTIFAEYLQ